jgi:hypothetical protein
MSEEITRHGTLVGDEFRGLSRRQLQVSALILRAFEWQIPEKFRTKPEIQEIMSMNLGFTKVVVSRNLARARLYWSCSSFDTPPHIVERRLAEISPGLRRMLAATV